MACWLVKEEPSHYSFEQLVRDGRTRWSGVRNPLAQKHLRAMRPGDDVLFYATGPVKAIVGVARVVSAPYPDPDQATGRAAGGASVPHVVDIEPVHALVRPVPLAAIKADPFFADFDLVRLPRLSVMPVTRAQWTRLLRMAR